LDSNRRMLQRQNIHPDVKNLHVMSPFIGRPAPSHTSPPAAHQREAAMKKLWITVPLILLTVAVIVLTYRVLSQKRLQHIDAVSRTGVALPVKILAAEKRDVERFITHAGVLQAWQQSVIFSEVGGKVQAISAKVGDTLEPGNPIMKIDDELIGYMVEQAQANVLQLEANHQTSLRELERNKSLFRNKVISDYEFDLARAKEKADRALLASAQASLKIVRRDLRETRITSPIRGILAERTVDLGTSISQGTRVATVIDIETVKIRIGISEKDIAEIKEHQPAIITTDALPDQTYAGTVYSVGTKADDPTLTFPVEIVINNNREPILKPGMVAQVSIRTGAYAGVFPLPQEAVLKANDDFFVWSVDRDTARRVGVTVGPIVRSEFIIESGLVPGQPVVVAGQHTLEDGSPVVIVP
jgi:membrane fusion protein, multidrug efflux system